MGFMVQCAGVSGPRVITLAWARSGSASPQVHRPGIIVKAPSGQAALLIWFRLGMAFLPPIGLLVPPFGKGVWLLGSGYLMVMPPTWWREPTTARSKRIRTIPMSSGCPSSCHVRCCSWFRLWPSRSRAELRTSMDRDMGARGRRMALRGPILVIRHSGRQKHNAPLLEALRGPAGMDLAPHTKARLFWLHATPNRDGAPRNPLRECLAAAHFLHVTIQS